MESPPQRRPSFGMLLRRSKSTELGKKAQAAKEAELERQRQNAMVPPRLPEFANNSEQLSKSLGNQLHFESSPQPSNPSARVGSLTKSHTTPVLPFDPYARTESMTHRGRYSYASSAISTLNSPRRVRRRKDPTPFNVLVIGNRSAGKTSFLEFLKGALALPPKKRSKKSIQEDEFYLPTPASGNFVPHFLETEMDGERIGLTLWDSEGFEKNVVDLQLREMSAFIESKFEETFSEERKVVRSPGVQDTHIHAVFLVLDPSHLDRNISKSQKSNLNGLRNANNGAYTRGASALDDEVDLQVLRMLYKKTTVIPVISKADTVTSKHMKVLKKAVWDSIKTNDLDPLEALGLEDDHGSDRIDEEDEDNYANESAMRESSDDADSENMAKEQRPTPPMSPKSPTSTSSKRLSSQSLRRHKAAQDESKEEELPFLPLSIISPDLYEPNVIGRQFVWGFADPYNETHCDFRRLKEAVFTEWRAELREASKEQWYEGWRTDKLKQRDFHHRY